MKNHAFAQIIPAIDLPRRFGIFDYAVDDQLMPKLAIGQIVRVPFRSKQVLGVVVGLKPNPSQTIKKIRPITNIENGIILPLYQIELIRWMSAYYFQSPALIAKAILPKLPKKTKTVLPVINRKILKPADQSIPVTVYASVNPYPTYLQKIRETKARNQQINIVFPTKQQADRFTQHMIKAAPDIICAQVTSETSPASLLKIWHGVADHTIDCVIGTKKSIFLPFADLGFIIIDSENDSSHKQWDQNPRYHAREVALKLAQFTAAGVLLQSEIPSVTTYSKALKGAHFVADKIQLRYEIVDLKNNRPSHGSAYVSDTAREHIALARQGIIFVHPSKGHASSVICQDCRAPLGCPVCAKPLAKPFEGGDDLWCRHCQTRCRDAETCPHCGSARLKPVGAGTARLCAELKRLFPNLRVSELTADTPPHIRQSTLELFYHQAIHILVATPGIFHDLAGQAYKPKTVIIPALEAFLAVPEYTNAEKACHLLYQAATLAQACIIQTHDPDHRVLKSLTDLSAFYAAELNERKQFLYPPFSRLVSVIVQDSSQTEAARQAEKLAAVITAANERLKLGCDILGPTAFYKIQLRNRFRYHLILKITNPKIDVTPLIDLIPDNCLIDTDPIDLA